MLIKITIKPSQKYDQLWRTEEGLQAYVTALPKDDETNRHLVEFLAFRFGIAKSLITIIKGLHSPHKTLVVSAPEKLVYQTIRQLEPAATQSQLL